MSSDLQHIKAAVPITVRNKEADALLARIRKETGKGPSEIILEALRREAAKLDSEVEKRRRRFEEWYDDYRHTARERNPDLFRGTLQEIMDEMYDENGLPR